MGEKTPATFKNLLDKDRVQRQSLDLEHFIVGIDNENRDVNKEERKKIDTNANKDSKLQCHTMVDEDHVVVQSNIQEKFVEEASLGKPGTVNNKFEVVQNEQKVLSTAERLVKDQRSCANSKKNIFKHDKKPDEQHTDSIDEMDAPFGTREPLNLRFADYRESVILEPPVTSFDNLFNGGMNLLQEDVTINNNSDLENCSAEVVDNGKNLHETRLNENDRLIDHAVNSEVIHKSSFGPREMELSEDAKSKAESCSYVDEENHSDLQDLIVRNGIRANKLKLFRDSVRRLERPLSVFAVIVSVLLFMADIVTDCLLAGEYYNEAKMELFYATAVFIIGPAVILSMVDLSWLYIDIKKRQSSDPGSYEWTNRQWIFTFRVLLGVFSLGRIVRDNRQAGLDRHNWLAN